MIKRRYFHWLLPCAVLLSFHAADQAFIDLNRNGKMDVYENPELPPVVRARDLISRLTLEEKIGLMGSNAIAVKRLGIKEFGWDNEGKHAIVSCFPSSIGIAAGWSPSRIFEIANALSDEARIMSRKDTAGGKQLRWLSYWAPTINMARDPRWGRTMEAYGEDPFLQSELAVPFIKGMQGNNDRYLKAVAGVNHMAVYNRELGRHELDAVVKDEKLLREYYLSAFKKCVISGGNMGIGASNNAVNGVPSCVNKWLLSHVLREEWGYKGYVFSDAASVSDVAGIRQYVPDQEKAMALAVQAGCDIDCGNSFQTFLKKTVDSHLLNEDQLDSSLLRSLTVRFELGMFDPARLNPYNKIPDALLDGARHRQIALDAARESIVLLKNQGNVLPVRTSVKTIVLAGPRADKPELGRKQTGSSVVNVSVLQGIKNRFSNTKVLYSKNITESVSQAADADLIVYCTSLMEGEVADRMDLRLSSRQEEDILKLSKTNKPVVVVLYSGAMVDVSPWIAQVSGLLEAWYPGEEGGNALADVLAGKVNPSGKLPLTFYENVNALPPFDDFDITKGRTYMYQKTKPRYPFGFGLSYTSFTTKLFSAFLKDQSLYVSVSVKNTGEREGSEVAQLYLSYSGDKSRTFPAKQLKGFQKVFLKPGEEKNIHFTLKPEDLAFYDDQMNYKVFAGTYRIEVGNSSENSFSSASFSFDKEIILTQGPKLVYSRLSVPQKKIVSGSYIPVDFECKNEGETSGKVEIMVDGQPYTVPDTYLGPKKAGKFQFMVLLNGAKKHRINFKDHPPVWVRALAGHPDFVAKAIDPPQIGAAGKGMDFEFSGLNNTAKAMVFNCGLELNGSAVERQKVTIYPGNEKRIRFSHTFSKPGRYEVTLNGMGKSRVVIGEAVKKPFLTFSNAISGFYQVDSTTFWASSTGSVGGTPIADNYGERTADDTYGLIYLPHAMSENSVAVVRIQTQEKTGNYAKTGLMVRNKVNEPGRSVGYCIAAVHSYYGGGGMFEWDAQSTGFLDSLKRFSLAPFPNKWIRIEKHKKQFIIWSGSDGIHWKKQLAMVMPDANAVQDVGVFITSDNPLEPCRVLFSDFKVYKNTAFLKETDKSDPAKKEKKFTAEPL